MPEPINPAGLQPHTRPKNPLSPGLPQNLFPGQQLPFSPSTFRPYGGLPPATQQVIAAAIAAQVATTEMVEQAMQSTGRVPPLQPVTIPPGTEIGPAGALPYAQQPHTRPLIVIEEVRPRVPPPPLSQSQMQPVPRPGAYLPGFPPLSQSGWLLNALKGIVKGNVPVVVLSLVVAKILNRIERGEVIFQVPFQLTEDEQAQLDLARIDASKSKIPGILDWVDP